MTSWLLVAVGFATVGPWLFALERRARGPRPHARRDAAWWLITPVLSGGLTRAALLGATVVLSALGALPGLLPLGSVFWPLRFVLALLAADVVGYASHRLRHAVPELWRFHAVHHTPRRLDALDAARLHPVDELVDGTLVGVALLLLGFDAATLAVLGPVLLVHTLLVHADLPWDFGPLRRVLVSPALHRAHHAGRGDTGYAGMFAFLDVALGTFHLPAVRPEATGLPGTSGPDDVASLLLSPFRRT